jgi:hypothetical protein
MSADTTVKGTLTFDGSALDDLLTQLEDDEPDVAEFAEQLEGALHRTASRLYVDAELSLSSDGNLWFHEWLSDLAVAAVAGHLDVWVEGQPPGARTRIMAGGEEVELA